MVEKKIGVWKRSSRDTIDNPERLRLLMSEGQLTYFNANKKWNEAKFQDH